MGKLKRSDRLRIFLTDWGRKMTIELGHGEIAHLSKNKKKIVITFWEAQTHQPVTRKKKN